MTDLSLAVQQGVYAALSTGVTAAQVKASVKEDDALPVVFFGEDVIENFGTKDSRLERHSLVIRSLDQGSSRQRLLGIQEQIRVALEGVAIVATGAVLSPPSLDTAHHEQVDESSFAGSQTFTIFAQPA